MKLKEVLEVFRDLANRHTQIESFNTGLESEHNDSLIKYPALRVSFPYSVETDIEDDNSSLLYTFKLSLLVNEVIKDTGTNSYPVNTNYVVQQDNPNEIDTPLVDEILMREQALAIMSQYIEGLRIVEESFEYFTVDSYDISSLERYANDYVTGVEVNVSIRVSNDYKCESQENIDNSIWKDESTDIIINPVIKVECPECPPCPPIPFTQYSMGFNGVNKHIDARHVTAYNDFDWNKPWSFTTRVKFVDITATAAILGKRTTGFVGFLLILTGGVLRMVLRDTISTGILLNTNTLPLVNNTWATIAFSNSGSGLASGIKIYIDGVSIATTTTSDTLGGSIINTDDLTFGQSLGFYLNGKMGYTRCWNIELSPADMLEDHNGGIMLEDPIQSANLVVGWKSGQDALKLTNWAFPDESGNNFDPVIGSQNMTFADRSLDVPS